MIRGLFERPRWLRAESRLRTQEQVRARQSIDRGDQDVLANLLVQVERGDVVWVEPKSPSGTVGGSDTDTRAYLLNQVPEISGAMAVTKKCP